MVFSLALSQGGVGQIGMGRWSTGGDVLHRLLVRVVVWKYS